MYIKLETTDLDEAFKELRKVQQHYIGGVLKNLKVNFIEKNKCEFIGQHFFPNLKIDELLTLHEDIDRDLEILTVSHVKVTR